MHRGVAEHDQPEERQCCTKCTLGKLCLYDRTWNATKPLKFCKQGYDDKG